MPRASGPVKSLLAQGCNKGSTAVLQGQGRAGQRFSH